jgi:glutamate synthase (NADPH/NADH) small chain
VTLFEKADRIGGLLRYGIPDFKMEKHLIDRRMRQMEAEGVEFRTGVEVGATLSIKSLLEGYDAVALTGGAEWPRDLPCRPRARRHPFRDGLPGAAEQARRRRRRGARRPQRHDQRQGQARRGDRRRRHRLGLRRHLQPPGRRLGHPARGHAAAARKENKALTWPDWPLKMRTSSSHEEGVERDFAVLTKRRRLERPVEALECVRVTWERGHHRGPGSGFQ